MVAGSTRERSRAREGAVIMAVFALLWAAGASGLGDPAVVGASIGLTVAALIPAFSRQSRRVERRPVAGWERRFNGVGVAETAGIAIVVAVLIAVGVPALIPAGVCLVVGAHFLPLARIFDQPQYRWTCVAACLVAVAGFAAYAVDGATARAVAGVGAAVVLWATALHVGLRG